MSKLSVTILISFLQVFLGHIEVFAQSDGVSRTRASASEEVENNTNSCFPFHKLPGEHFCQFYMPQRNPEYFVVRLEGGLNGNNQINRNAQLQAKVYKLNRESREYCLDRSKFQPRNTYHGDKSNFSNPNNLVGNQGMACRANGRSHVADFNHQKENGEIVHIKIGKYPEKTNLCDLKTSCVHSNSCNERNSLNTIEVHDYFPGTYPNDHSQVTRLTRASSNPNRRIQRYVDEKYNRIRSRNNVYEYVYELWHREFFPDNPQCIESSRVALYEAIRLFGHICNNKNIEPLATAPTHHDKDELLPLGRHSNHRLRFTRLVLQEQWREPYTILEGVGSFISGVIPFTDEFTDGMTFFQKMDRQKRVTKDLSDQAVSYTIPEISCTSSSNTQCRRIPEGRKNRTITDFLFGDGQGSNSDTRTQRNNTWAGLSQEFEHCLPSSDTSRVNRNSRATEGSSRPTTRREHRQRNSRATGGAR